MYVSWGRLNLGSSLAVPHFNLEQSAFISISLSISTNSALVKYVTALSIRVRSSTASDGIRWDETRSSFKGVHTRSVCMGKRTGFVGVV